MLGDGQFTDVGDVYWCSDGNVVVGFAGVVMSLLWALLQDMLLAAVPALWGLPWYSTYPCERCDIVRCWEGLVTGLVSGGDLDRGCWY